MIRQITTLLSGNAASQVVNVLTVVLVVTVFFPPAEFGRYAVLMAYVGVLSSIASFRYELSIVSASRDAAAHNLFWSSLAIATGFSAIVFPALLLLSVVFGNGFLQQSSPAIVVVLTFLKAADQIIASLLYRHEAYLNFSTLKLAQALILFAGFLCAGLAGWGLRGLLVSTIIAYAIFAVAGALAIQRYHVGRGVTRRRMWLLVRRNIAFVRFSTPQTLIDNLLSNGLHFVLVAWAGPAIVGYFGFLQRTVKAPLGLIFAAIAQVLFRSSAKNVADVALVKQKLRQTLVLTGVILGSTALGIGIVYYCFEHLAFLVEWKGLRDHMLAFSFWMIVPFLFSPFAALPIVYGRQKQYFQVATAFNLLSLGMLTAMIAAGAVNFAFFIVGLIGVLYFLALVAWMFRIATYGNQS